MFAASSRSAWEEEPSGVVEHDNDDEGDAELVSLVRRVDEEMLQRKQPLTTTERPRWTLVSTTTRRATFLLWLFVIMGGASFLLWWRLPSSPQEQEVVELLDDIYPAFFECPKQDAYAESSLPNDFNHNEATLYIPKSNKIMNNIDEYIENYRNASFDGWRRTYEQYKQDLYHWKATRFVPNLQSGDAIYESACGVGHNLHATLEIVGEVSRGTVANLTVYGNEYVQESVRLAQSLARRPHFYPSETGRVGRICRGNSLNLSFVPTDSFDLVFTGYITPMNDPLNLSEDEDEDDADGSETTTTLRDQYRRLCDDGNAGQQVQQMQRRQEDWYGQWVSEMVRIARPGAPVIAEQVSQPLCQQRHDWGGVDREFWRRAPALYGWEVDLAALEFENDLDRHSKLERYHVFMRKKQKKRRGT